MTVEIVYMGKVPLGLKEEDVWRCLGARRGAVAALKDEVAGMTALGEALATPAAVYIQQSVNGVERAEIGFDGGVVLRGKILAHCFQGAQQAIFLVVTIGRALETRVSDLFAQGRSIEAFVLDAVGSAAVMNAFSHLANRILLETSDRGWQTGLCLRPGQSYWDITGQRTVFQVVPADKIGVELTESCVMVPQKSQSAVIPLGPNMKVHGDPNQSYCRYCQAARCPMRTEPVA